MQEQSICLHSSILSFATQHRAIGFPNKKGPPETGDPRKSLKKRTFVIRRRPSVAGRARLNRESPPLGGRKSREPAAGSHRYARRAGASALPRLGCPTS